MINFLFAMLLLSATSVVVAQPDAVKPEIKFLYMSGTGCGPCEFWLAEELPKLQKTDVYKHIKYYTINKSIRSSVPPRFFLHNDLKPLKEELDRASGGQTGSAQTVILVNGKVYDYAFGSPAVDDLRVTFEALLAGKASPFPRCTLRKNGFCAEQVEPKL